VIQGAIFDHLTALCREKKPFISRALRYPNAFTVFLMPE